MAAGYGDVPWVRLPLIGVECRSNRFAIRLLPPNLPGYPA
jgi:hypothetical protein